MKVINETNKTVIAEDIIEAKSLWEQNVGMLKYKEPHAMLIKTRWGIHTFFMKYPIDVMILDKNNTVVKLHEHMKPNSMLFWNPKYKNVIELPKNSIHLSKTKLNDTIRLAQVPFV